MNLYLPKQIAEILFFQGIPTYIIIVILTFILCLFFVVILTLIERANKIEKLSNSSKEKVYEDALNILDNARGESLRILSRAQSRAQSVMDSAYTVNKEGKDEFTRHMANVYKKQEQYMNDLTEEFLKSFRSKVIESSKESIQSLTDVAQDLKEEAISNVEQFKSDLGKQVVEAKEKIEGKLVTEYSRIDDDVKKYKEDRIKELNNKVLDILSDVFTKVIGKEINQEKYEKIVLTMLKDEFIKSGLSQK